MELYEENKNESDEKKTTEKNLIKYKTDVHIINILKEILHDTKETAECYDSFEELSMKMKMKVKRRPFQYYIPNQVASYKPELSKIEEITFVNLYYLHLILESEF